MLTPGVLSRAPANNVPCRLQIEVGVLMPLLVVLAQAFERGARRRSKAWFVSTREIQLASLEFCCTIHLQYPFRFMKPANMMSAVTPSAHTTNKTTSPAPCGKTAPGTPPLPAPPTFVGAVEKKTEEFAECRLRAPSRVEQSPSRSLAWGRSQCRTLQRPRQLSLKKHVEGFPPFSSQGCQPAAHLR